MLQLNDLNMEQFLGIETVGVVAILFEVQKIFFFVYPFCSSRKGPLLDRGASKSLIGDKLDSE